MGDKREEYASSRHKKSAAKLSSEKFKGKYPEMENNLDAWAQELREAGCCLSGFKVGEKNVKIQWEEIKMIRNFMYKFNSIIY